MHFILLYKIVLKSIWFLASSFKNYNLILLWEGVSKQYLDFVYIVHMILFHLIQQHTNAEIHLIPSLIFFSWMVILGCIQCSIISLLLSTSLGLGFCFFFVFILSIVLKHIKCRRAWSMAHEAKRAASTSQNVFSFGPSISTYSLLWL